MTKDDDYSSFVAARWTRLFRTAVLLGCNHAEAEDLVQNALLKVYVHWDKVVRADDRDGYVHRMLLNTHTTAMRRRWRGETATSELPDTPVPDASADVDVAHVVLESLGRLTPEHRAVVVLRHYSQLSEAQMAAALGLPAGTVKSRLARAMRRLAADPSLNALQETS